MLWERKGKKRNCELHIDAAGDLVLRIEGEHILFISSDTGKLNRYHGVDPQNAGVKVNRNGQIKDTK